MLLLLMSLESLKKELELSEKLVNLIVCIMNVIVYKIFEFELKMWRVLHFI